MACAKCSFYLPKKSTEARLLEVTRPPETAFWEAKDEVLGGWSATRKYSSAPDSFGGQVLNTFIFCRRIGN